MDQVRRVEIFNAITNERDRQDEKFSGQWAEFKEAVGCDGYSRVPALHQMNTILAEEVGEAAKEVNEDNLANLRTELIQVAAVTVAFLEALP